MAGHPQNAWATTYTRFCELICATYCGRNFLAPQVKKIQCQHWIWTQSYCAELLVVKHTEQFSPTKRTLRFVLFQHLTTITTGDNGRLRGYPSHGNRVLSLTQRRFRVVQLLINTDAAVRASAVFLYMPPVENQANDTCSLLVLQMTQNVS